MGMKLFSFGRESNASADEHAQHPGETGGASASVQGGVAAAAAAEARANALDLSGKTKRGYRRKPADDAGNVGANSAVLQARIEAQIGEQLEALHDPKCWGALLACPGDVGLALTGRQYWDISKEERATLGATGSAFARTMMITNPRALACLMLSGALFAVFVPRIMKEAEHQRGVREAKEKEKKANAGQATSN